MRSIDSGSRRCVGWRSGSGGNALIWQSGSAKGHVESYFMKFNEPQTGRAAWIKFTLYAPTGKPEQTVGETWAIFFDANDPAKNVGMKETVSIADCRIERNPLRLQFGGNVFAPGATSGSLKNDRGESIAWDLTWTDGDEPFALFPFEKMYTFKLPKSKALTPFPNSRYSGTLIVGGADWAVSGLRGMQGHNWGEEHAHFYGWVQGSVFDDGADAWFEGFSGKVKIGPVVTPFLSMAFLKLDGRLYRFDRAASWFTKSVELTNNRWTFQIPGPEHVLRGEVGAPTERFCGLHYYDPTGKLSYCLNSKVSDARIELVDKASGETIRTLTSTAGFALEVLTKQPGHGVTMVA